MLNTNIIMPTVNTIVIVRGLSFLCMVFGTTVLIFSRNNKSIHRVVIPMQDNTHHYAENPYNLTNLTEVGKIGEFLKGNRFAWNQTIHSNIFWRQINEVESIINRQNVVTVHLNGVDRHGLTEVMSKRFEKYLTTTNIRQPLTRDALSDGLLFRINISGIMQQSFMGSPFDPLSSYPNHCWIAKRPEQTQESSSILSNRTGGGHLLCIPRVYIIGSAKGGTTDLWSKLLEHPSFLPRDRKHNVFKQKEPAWWNNGRLWYKVPMEDYIGTFGQTHATDMQKSIIVDASSSYLDRFDGWQQIPGNVGFREPRIIMAHTLRMVVPEAKLIVILRNPTDRIYSHFRMKSPRLSRTDFHSLVVEAINNTLHCFRTRTIRSCAYDMTISKYEYPSPGGVFLRIGLYFVYLRDWLQVFPREQFFIIRADDYFDDRANVLSRMFTFLGVPDLEKTHLEHIASNTFISNAGTEKTMLPETKSLLDAFYKPFNKLLAALLCDSKFEWNK